MLDPQYLTITPKSAYSNNLYYVVRYAAPGELVYTVNIMISESRIAQANIPNDVIQYEFQRAIAQIERKRELVMAQTPRTALSAWYDDMYPSLSSDATTPTLEPTR